MFATIQIFAKNPYHPPRGGYNSGQPTSNQQAVSRLCEKLPDFFSRVCETRYAQIMEDFRPTCVLLPASSTQAEDLVMKIYIYAFDTDPEMVKVLQDALEREVTHQLDQGWPIEYTQPNWIVKITTQLEAADELPAPLAH